ncbi:MAG TPA: hypothetical protein OIM17_07170 [Clostridiales bacterium]|nr:hypothetical protein [Clostridiales bacterium]
MKRIFNGSGGRKAVLILSLCLIFALAVGTTVALLVAHTNAVTNTFTAAKSEIKIEEKFDGNQKTSITVMNKGTATSYVRVKLVMNWVDGDGKVVSGGSLPMVKLNTDDGWFEKGGIYYYKTPVAPNDAATGKVTSNLLKTPITQPEGAPDGCHLEVTVLAESIQAAPSTAVEGAWKVVKVGQDSCLTLKDTTTP